ncbi:MAG: hypothetical protein COC15_03300 [Legionellales bacterium]|nr:MAG: hypothetical protein COC15_03300 [Legionellales bacterium]
MFKKLLAEIEQGAVIITANARLARFIIDKYNLQQQESSMAWESPRVYSWSSWLQILWHQLEFKSRDLIPRLLGKHENMLIWQNIIENDADMPLLRSSSTAALALRAQELLSAYTVIELSEDSYVNNADVMTFVRWCSSYTTYCVEHNIIAADRLSSYITENINKLTINGKILTIGFLEFTPAQDVLFQALAAKSIAWQPPMPSVMYTHAESTSTELQLAIQWAYQKYTANNLSNIGIVVPTLVEQRSEILYLCNKYLPKGSFNIAAPKLLSSYAMLAIAFTILKDPLSDCNIASPYIADNAAANTAADPTELPKQTTAIEWVNIFKTILEASGWLVACSLTHNEQQLLHKFQELLLEYSKLDLILGQHSYYRALQVCMQLANNTTFLPKAVGSASIHILGVLESAGIPFDYLWVNNLTQSSWPGTISPNPFIPVALQKELQMPKSSAARELLVANNIMQLWQASVQTEIVMSYARVINANQELPSSLITKFPKIVFEYNNLFKQAIASNIELEQFIDDLAPKITNTEKVCGGARILQLQAACPFRAFAELRLQAVIPDMMQLGFSAAERGNSLHKVLAAFWTKIATQQNLLKLDKAGQIAILKPLIAQEIIYKFQQSYIKLEQRRLLQLLLQWLEFERQRQDFVVLACEQRLQGTIGALQFNLRIDRIDKLATGAEIIIDYKTGICSVQDWLGDRPNEPQLPLYYLLHTPQATDISFAIVRKDAIKMLTLANMDHGWQEVITKLANDFHAGIAVVDPKKNPASCMYCKLQSVCRING